MRERVRTERRRDCSSDVIRRPERASRSSSCVSLTKSAAASVMRGASCERRGASDVKRTPASTPTIVITRRGQRDPRSGKPSELVAAGAARRKPFDVRSNAHETMMTTGKPVARATTMALSVQSGSRRPCSTGSMTCRTANAKTA